MRFAALPTPLLGVLIYLTALGARLPVCLTRPLDGDEAVQGIVALRLLDGGDWSWFFPDQKYAGMLETIPQALFQAIDEGSVFLLRLPLVLLAAGTVLLLAYLALELSGSRLTFLTVGFLAALFPPLYVWLGSWQTAGYNSSLFLGVLAVYLATRALRPTLTERRRTLLIGAAGLSAGLALYQQPMSLFVMAALGTTAVVATWPRPLDFLGRGQLAGFAGLVLVGASPQIIAVATGLGSDTSNNPLPPGYSVTPDLLATVAGFPLGDRAALPALGSGGGYGSMTWNLLGVQFGDDLLVPTAVAVALAGLAWACVLGTLIWALGNRPSPRALMPNAARWSGAREPRAVRLCVAVAAGAMVAGVIVALALLRLPPWAKYAFGLFGFAALGLGIVATQLRIGRPAAALVSLGIAVLAAGSVHKVVEMARFHERDHLHADRSWLLSRIGAVPAQPDQVKVVYGDYWIVYPLEFMSGGSVQAVATAFNRFPEREPSGQVPRGRVIVPVVSDLAFQPEVDLEISQDCVVRSAEENGEARLLVAQCGHG